MGFNNISIIRDLYKKSSIPILELNRAVISFEQCLDNYNIDFLKCW